MEKKNPLRITETILRDAHQSQAATRMRIEDMLPACELLDNMGYWSLECWGGATFDVCMRFLNEDPWERLRTLKAHMPKTKLQMLFRGQNILGYKHYADDVVDEFCGKSIDNGIDIIRIFDALNDVRNLEQAIKSTKKYGGQVEATLSYTISPIHNEDYFVKLAKELGADVTAEVTPHHFTLTESAVLEHGAMAKMNPPLRTEKDRLGIIEGIRDGSIDMIATDHAPHSAEEKAVEPVWKAPSGIIGLETALALAVTNLVKPGHLTMVQLMEKMSLNPAKLYRFDKGSVAEGADADLVIFDENERWTVTEDDIASKSHNTPFIGAELYGRVKYTICGGRIVYEDKKTQA